MKRYLLLFFAPLLLLAQTNTGGLTPKGAVDRSGATSSKPSKAGTTLPATCSTGETYFKTDATAGLNWYLCTGTNTWTAAGTVACASCVVASSPGVGIAHFAGSTQTVTSSAIVNADITNSTIDLTAKVTGALPTANMAAAALVRTCEIIVGDPGAGSVALANDNDTPDACTNDSGATMTITGVHCYSDAGSPTVTPIITGGSSTSILSGALTCSQTQGGAAGTLNGTPTQTNGQSVDGNVTNAGGTAKYIVLRITRTL